MRRLFEFSLLFTALMVGLLWWYVHWAYILYPDNCLLHVAPRSLPPDTILQVEAYSNNSELWALRQQVALKRYRKLSGLGAQSNPLETSAALPLGHGEGQELKASLQWLSIHLMSNSSNSSSYNNNSYNNTSYNSSNYNSSFLSNGSAVGALNGSEEAVEAEEMEQWEGGRGEEEEALWRDVDYFFGAYTLYEILDPYVLFFESPDYTLVECTQEPGYLSLTSSSRRKFNITVLKVYVDPDNSTCFGGSFGFLLTKLFFGYEMMVIASFKYLLPEGHNSAYVKDVLRGSQYYYRVQWMSKWLYVSGVLPALFFTLVASILLRQLHFHFFKFITHFQQLVNHGVPMPVQTAAQIPFLVATYATIGLIIVMSESLGDDSLFSLLMVATVWEVDQFYIIFCRQPTSRRYFPWFFFIYHFLPYGYFVRFGGQFWFIPFLFHWLLVQHAMVFFLHHIELAAVLAGPQQLHPVQGAREPGRVVLAELPQRRDPDVAEGDVQDTEEASNGHTIAPLAPSDHPPPSNSPQATLDPTPPPHSPSSDGHFYSSNTELQTDIRLSPLETLELRRRRLAALSRSQSGFVPS
eukprot:Em0011g658a